MTSLQKYDRICNECGKAFIAKTSVTKFCDVKCNSRFYKKEKRIEKLALNQKEFIIASQGIDPVLLSKKKYLTVKEACVYLEISRTTLYRIRKMGFVPQIGIGSKVLFKREDLDEAFDALTTIENYK